MLFSLSVHSQNLVMNPSFEETDCEDSDTDFDFPALNWYNATNSSPDYYSMTLGPGECSNGVPLGSQAPRTGDFMIGLWGSQLNSPTRDYIQSRLLAPMVEDSNYCIEMYVLRIESSPLAINRFGVQLSQDSLYNFSTSSVLLGGLLLSNPVDEFLTNAENWMRLSWDYRAQGGEQFITLGNFWTESELEYVDVEGTNAFPVAYYHVDDVSVIQCVAASLTEEHIVVSIGPNPVSDYLQVSLGTEPVEWFIYSLDGRVVRNGVLKCTGSIDFQELSSSMYILELRGKSGKSLTTTICKK